MSEPDPTWVYAVVPAVPPVPLDPTAGVAGEPVRVLSHAGISAVVGSLSRAQAEPAALRRQLSDPEWLAHAARSHHRVVTTCTRSGPTVPFRLATIYHDDQRVAGMLMARHRELVAALATVTRRTEWGVQAFARPDAATGAAAATADPGRPGTAYLHRRRAERAAADAWHRSAAATAEQLHRRLGELAAASARPTATAPPPADSPGRPVLDAAYLVDDRRRDEFTAAVRELGQRYPALRLRLTGPWPAYSFVGLAPEVAE